MSEEQNPSMVAGLRRHDWAEILSTVLLAIATVATAWSGYQATRWSGEQAIAFSAASAARVESGKASTRAGQQTQIDVAVFTQWVDAYARDEKVLSDFYFKRFRPEFKPALDAWIATRPLTNPDAPLTPVRHARVQARRSGGGRSPGRPGRGRRPRSRKRTTSARTTTCSALFSSQRRSSSRASRPSSSRQGAVLRFSRSATSCSP